MKNRNAVEAVTTENPADEEAADKVIEEYVNEAMRRGISRRNAIRLFNKTAGKMAKKR